VNLNFVSVRTTKEGSSRISGHQIQTNTRHEKQLCGRGDKSSSKKYSSLLEGLRSVGQVKGWQTQQIVFVGGACGSVHVESFNKNMKALGVLESKWNPIRQKLVRLLLEEQDKVLRSHFAQKGGTRGQRGGGTHGQGREHVKWDMYV
jgi:hypothetical protein